LAQEFLESSWFVASQKTPPAAPWRIRAKTNSEISQNFWTFFPNTDWSIMANGWQKEVRWVVSPFFSHPSFFSSNKKSNRALHFPRRRKKDVVGATSAENVQLPPDARQDRQSAWDWLDKKIDSPAFQVFERS
jgi:hypothetical protein